MAVVTASSSIAICGPLTHGSHSSLSASKPSRRGSRYLVVHPAAAPGRVVRHQDRRTSGQQRHAHSASFSPALSNRATARLGLNCRSPMTLVAPTRRADRRCQLFMPSQPLFTPGQLLFIRNLRIGSAQRPPAAWARNPLTKLRRQSSSIISAISGQEATPSRVNCTSSGRTSRSSRIE